MGTQSRQDDARFMLWRSNFRILARTCISDYSILNLKKKGRSEERPEFDREETSKKEENTIRLDNQTVLQCNIHLTRVGFKPKNRENKGFYEFHITVTVGNRTVYMHCTKLERCAYGNGRNRGIFGGRAKPA